MKKKVIIAASLLALAACTKPSSSTTTATTSSSTTTATTTADSNTVTITDNGNTYTEKGGGTSSPSATQNILCTLSKETTASSLKLYIVGTGYPVQMQLTLNEVGPISGTGVYALADTPTTYSHYDQGTVTETFSGGQTYNIDTSYVNVTTASNNTVIGTFRLHVTNAAGRKVITGNFNCKASTVN